MNFWVACDSLVMQGIYDQNVKGNLWFYLMAAYKKNIFLKNIFLTFFSFFVKIFLFGLT